MSTAGSSEDNVGYKVVAATVVGLFLSFGAVIMRFIARRYQGMRTYWEDWFIYAGLICKLGIDIGGILLLNHGLGKRVATLEPDQLVEFAKIQYSGSFLYPACITFVKLSILMQYRRLFSHHSKSFHCAIHILITIVAVWGAGIVLTAFFLCVPMEANWDPTILDKTCIPIIPFYYGLQIPNIVTDVLIIVVPIREVLGLQLTKKLKVGAITMFALGVITLIFDIIRLVALLAVTETQDFTHDIVDVAVWTTIEPTVAILAVCIPSVRTLYRRKRQSAHYTDGSTTLGNASSIRELKSSTNESDVEAAEMPSPAPSAHGATEEAQKHWPPVSMLLESERPFQRFEEFDGRQRS